MASFPFQIASVLVVTRLLSDTRPYQLGLTLRGADRNILAGWLAWFATTPLVLTLHALVSWGYPHLVPVPPEEHPISQLIQSQPPPFEWLLVVLDAVVIAPLLEELVFRGFLQPWFAFRAGRANIALAGSLFAAILFRAEGIGKALTKPIGWPLLHELAPVLFVLLMIPGYVMVGFVNRRWLRPEAARAIYGTALLFAVFHANVWPTPIPLFLLGLVLGYLALRTQSLVGPIVVHALINGTACMTMVFSYPAPAPEPANGNVRISAVRRLSATCTSTAVPGSWLPRRT
jgi:membrane protease YdiL (CAAX protease family)